MVTSKNFIQDIRTDINPCSLVPGYEPFSTTLWGGIVEGCDCSDATGVPKQDLLARTCSQIELNNGCREIDSMDPKYLNIYRGRSICMKRGDINFFNAVRPDINGACPADYQSCGDDVTPPSKTFCVKSLTDCPINSVKIIKSGSGGIGSDYQSRDLEEGWKIVFSPKEANKMPIEDTKLTEGAPCINPQEVDITKGRYVYPLSRTISNQTYKHHGCHDSINDEIFKDHRYTKIDQVDEKKLFEDNGIYLQLKSLPLNQIEYTSASYFYGLFVRSTLEHELSCEYSGVGLSRTDIKAHQSNFSKIEYWHRFLNKTCLFFISAVLILFIPFLFMMAASFFSNNITLLSLIKPWSVFANFTIIAVTCVVILVTFISMYCNWQLSQFIFLIVKHECSNKQTLHVWVHLYEILLVSNQMKFFVIGMCACSLVAQGIFLKYFWNIDQRAREASRSEDHRMSHSKLKEEK